MRKVPCKSSLRPTVILHRRIERFHRRIALHVLGKVLIDMRYAAYGSNLHPFRIKERVPSARLLGPAFHAGLGLRFRKLGVDQSAKCTIDLSGSGVHFAVYEMSIADKCVLDRIEGVGRGHVVGTVNLQRFGECAT